MNELPAGLKDWSHLDYWRMRSLGDKVWALGPIHVRVPKWSDKTEAFVVQLAATPRHGMLWSDAEALGHLGAQISKEASRVARNINGPWRAALRDLAQDQEFNCGPLVVNRKTIDKLGDYRTGVETTYTKCFTFRDGTATMDAFMAALHRGFTKTEAKRLSALTGQRFLSRELVEPPGFEEDERCWSSTGWTWPDATREHPVWRAVKAMCLLNNDEPFQWPRWKPGTHPSISVHFGMGWLRRKEDAA